MVEEQDLKEKNKALREIVKNIKTLSTKSAEDVEGQEASDFAQAALTLTEVLVQIDRVSPTSFETKGQ